MIVMDRQINKKLISFVKVRWREALSQPIMWSRNSAASSIDLRKSVKLQKCLPESTFTEKQCNAVEKDVSWTWKCLKLEKSPTSLWKWFRCWLNQSDILKVLGDPWHRQQQNRTWQMWLRTRFLKNIKAVCL